MSLRRVRTLFVNSGILGQRTFARFIDDAVVRGSTDVDAVQTILTDGLTPAERVVRRALCTRLWPDGLGGLRNLDLARFRAEWNAGLVARRRIEGLERQAARRFDVLHFHRQSTAYASVDRMRETPSIVSVDCTQQIVARKASTDLERRSYGPNIRRDGEIFRNAKLIIIVSQWAAECLKADYPDCTTEIAVMQNPVQLDAFEPSWADARHRRAQTPGYKPRVLFVGGDFVRKGGYDLLEAWRDGCFAERAHLDIVSDWPIETRSLGPGATRHTGVVSHSDRWRRLWREADMFALPTRDEAFGIAFQEAAAAGLPSIGTSINAVPELIENERTGILVAPRDREALVAALDRLLRSRDLRHAMGACARQRIMTTADPRTYRERLVGMVQRVSGMMPCAA